MKGAEVTRIVAPSKTYGWLVRVNDIMLDLVVCGGRIIRLDRSTGFSDLHVNDLKRLSALRIDDMIALLEETHSSVVINNLYLEIPDDTYDLLMSNDFASQHAGFNDLMVWVGKELTLDMDMSS